MSRSMAEENKPEENKPLEASESAGESNTAENAAATAPAESVKPPLSSNLIETRIIEALDPSVKQSDAPASSVSPQALKHGHPKRKGLFIFCPHRLVETVWQISADEFQKLGIQGVILDLDNTLVRWQKDEMTEEVTAWLKAVQERNIKLCILSNSLMGQRSQRIAERLNSPYVLKARKPAKSGFERAMEAMGTVPATTAVVGDQMFTDIWGGNRVGIYTIMVKPIHKREFAYTRYVSRPPEKLLLKYFKRSGHL